MKKTLAAAAIAGLIPLAACSGPANNSAAENAAESPANADYYQAQADDQANAIVANQDAASAAIEANSANATGNTL
jgi:hypothetical protein